MIELGDSDSNLEIPDAISMLAEEFLGMVRAGLNPDINAFCVRHPDQEERIRDLFATLLLVEQCGGNANRNVVFRADEELNERHPEHIGDFKIIREIGRGGMGIVYEAEQQSLGRRVALKVLPQSVSLSASTVERFRRESRAAAKLHHSNIVPVFGVGEDDGLHYYVMQYIQGVGLDQVLSQLGRPNQFRAKNGLRSLSNQTSSGVEAVAAPSPLGAMPSNSSGATGSEERVYWKRVALIGMQLANALHFAHTQGVLHRDVKPANVLLDTNGLVWLADFGLAQATDDANLTRSGDIVGTLRYLAPERLEGGCSQQSDVYGLGITLYEMLTLVPAFPDLERATLIRQIVQHEPKRIRSINPNVPRDLETIIAKSIEKEPSQRYKSAEEFADDLSRFLNDRPILARRVILVEKAWRWCRRNPSVATLSCAVCLLLLGLSLAWGMFRLVQSDRDRARLAERRANESRERANREEAVAMSRAHLATAIGHRNSALLGSKSRALQEIQKALLFAPPTAIQLELRNEAIAAMAQTNAKVGKKWNLWKENAKRFAFDRMLSRFAMLYQDNSLTIWNAESNEQIGSMQPQIQEIESLQFSHGGRFILATSIQPNSTIEVWDLNEAEKVVGPLANCWAHHFDNKETTLAVSHEDGTIQFYDLEDGSLKRQLKMKGEPISIVFSPDDKHLAVVLKDTPNRVYLIDSNTGSEDCKLESEGDVRRCSWHPDNKRIALCCASPNHIEIWDVQKQRKLATMVGHQQEVGIAEFDKHGRYMSSSSWDGTLRLWEVNTGKEVIAFTGGGAPHGGHEKVMAIGLSDREIFSLELDLATGFERLTSDNSKAISTFYRGDVSCDERLLTAGTFDSLQAWDLDRHLKLAAIPATLVTTIFSDLEKMRFVTISKSAGMQIWPVTKTESGWSVGPPKETESGPINALNSSATADGERFAIIDGQSVYVLTATGRLVSRIDAPPQHEDVSISPNGKFIATFGWHSQVSCIWDVDSGRLLKSFDGRLVNHCFTPDSEQLVTCNANEYVFRKLDDWEVVRRVERRDCVYPSCIAYSANGDLVAMELNWGSLHLLRADTFQTVAILESPAKDRPSRFQFSKSGNTIFAFHHLLGEVQVWRIDALRSGLANMRLDWERNSSDRDEQELRLDEKAKPLDFEFKLAESHSGSKMDIARNRIVEAEQAYLNNPQSSLQINELAWLILSAPEELRDAKRAVLLMESLQRTSEFDANQRNTLAVAYYRADRFEDAVALLRINVKEQEDVSLGFDLYFLAMCYWKLDQKHHATETLEWADRITKLKPATSVEEIEELNAFRAEAHDLIRGIGY